MWRGSKNLGDQHSFIFRKQLLVTTLKTHLRLKE